MLAVASARHGARWPTARYLHGVHGEQHVWGLSLACADRVDGGCRAVGNGSEGAGSERPSGDRAVGARGGRGGCERGCTDFVRSDVPRGVSTLSRRAACTSAHHGTPSPQVRRRSLGGLWNYPNSGVFAGSVRAVRLALARMRRLVLRGHFEDQAIFHLAMLQHPRAALLVDANASLFASQFAYDASWWERPACFDDYWDANGRAPSLLKAGNAPPPFALHFNGPAGRHRLGWCIAAVLAHTATAAAAAAAAAAITSDSPALPPLVPFYYVDVDDGGRRHLLPAYCGQSAAAGTVSLLKGATPPPGRRAARLVSCERHGEREHIGQRTPIECTNDRCVHAT